MNAVADLIFNRFSFCCPVVVGCFSPDEQVYVWHDVLYTGRAIVETPVPACSLCPAETLLGDDTKKLNSLRALRDNVLAKSSFGQKLIETYYSNADRVNLFLDNHPVIRESAKKALDLAVPRMNKITRHTADF